MENPRPTLSDRVENIVTEVLLPYVWRFDDNIEGLKEEERSLKQQRCEMERNIEGARRLRAESTSIEVQGWLNESTRKLEEAERILGGSGDLKPWHVISRYKVGKSAKEAAQGIATLRDDGNSIRKPTIPASMASISHRPTMEFKSRTRYEEDIMEYLKDANVRVIAVCGAGGVGKTTVAWRIEERVKKEKLFDEVVHVVVSQQIDVIKIQKEIAEILGLKLKSETFVGKAHELRTRLQDSKRKLIVFDDVWKSFEVEELGVPFRDAFVGCKIILTSRSNNLCEEMGAHKVVEVQLLDEEEAWELFRESAGECVDDSQLILLAKEVAKECSGLPLALVTVGKALKNEKDIRVWNDSLFQLKSSQVLEKVYMPLKLSYDSLKPESAKFLFLLCCLFPKDYDIPIEELTWYGIGLGMFEELGSIEEGRNSTHHSVERLKNRNLLMDGARDNHVRMLDVVRDVAIFIGSKEKDVFLKSLKASSMNSSSNLSSANCKWMSMDNSVGNVELSIGPGFPNLQLLMIYANDNRLRLEVMEELNVLSLTRVNLTSLAPSLELLKKLTTLVLYDCEVKDISAVGKLSSLEILSIHRCGEIEELPSDIGRLKCLKLLELTDCWKLKRIAEGVLSSLSKLEELKIIYCELTWHHEIEVNMVVKELESLPNLTSLEISLSQFIHPRKHERNCAISSLFKIGNWIRQLGMRIQTSDGLGQNISLGNLKSITIYRCDKLCHLFSVATARSLVQLEELEIGHCKKMEQVFLNEIESNRGNASIINVELPKLKQLWLYCLRNLEVLSQIIECPQLTDLKVGFCPKLRTKIGNCCTRQLQKLRIDNCEKIEEIFSDGIGTDRHIIFPELTRLTLENFGSIKFPKLEDMWVYVGRDSDSKNFPNVMIMIMNVFIYFAIRRLKFLT